MTGLADLLSSDAMPEGQIVPIVALGLLFGIPIVAVVGHYSYHAWKAWLELNLKREMVARGYTSQEIVQVLEAKSGGSVHSEAPPPWLPPAENQRSANC
jgi:hypothetical protein